MRIEILGPNGAILCSGKIRPEHVIMFSGNRRPVTMLDMEKERPKDLTLRVQLTGAQVLMLRSQPAGP